MDYKTKILNIWEKVMIYSNSFDLLGMHKAPTFINVPELAYT